MLSSSLLSKLGTIVQIDQIIEQFDQEDQQSFIRYVRQLIHNNNDSINIDNKTNTDRKISYVFFNHITMNASYEILDQCKSKAFKIQGESSKYKQFKPNNKLSTLPENIITHLAKYLSKSQSIVLGYVGRTLYITTQHKTFIINRRSIKNDESVNLTPRLIEQLINWDVNKDKKKWIKFGVGYCFPSCLTISQWLPDLDCDKMDMSNIICESEKRIFFYNLFESLNKLVVDINYTNYNYWQFIPIDLIFDISPKLKLDLEFSPIKIDHDHEDYKHYVNYKSCVESLKRFVNSTKKYMKNKKSMKSNNEITDFDIRKINSLKVFHKCDQLLGLLKNNFQSLWLDFRCGHDETGINPEQFSTDDILQLIFHKHLRYFRVDFAVNTDGMTVFGVYFQAWKIMLANYNSSCISSMNSCGDGKHKLLKLSLWDPQRFDRLVLNFGGNFFETYARMYGVIFDLDNASFHMLFGDIYLSNDKSGNMYIEKQLNDINFNPKTVELLMSETTDYSYLAVFDQLFLDPCSKAQKGVVLLKTGYNDISDIKGRAQEIHHYSNKFLSALVKHVSKNYTQWMNLNNDVTVSIQWDLNEILTQNMMKKLDLRNYVPDATILTNPLVELAPMEEFKYDSFVHRCLSNYTINTKSDFKFKSIGNIFYNLRTWIANYCKDYQGNILRLKLRVNINFDNSDY